ncbi:MAG: hypothetical protein L6R40_004439 [Gallowayella cf. fulva]|nr:MAG: hypothetical protein L6R40_004439 [Xanthomendoza cf. fulva]
MIRAALFHNVRCASRIAIRSHILPSRIVTPCLSLRPAVYNPSTLPQSARWYSAPAGLSKPEVEGRIMDLLKGFDKVTDQKKISGTSHFSNDLGLDSLDTVEVVMAIEEEFSIEIPDKEADAINSIDKAVEYILAQPDGKLATPPSLDLADR